MGKILSGIFGGAIVAILASFWATSAAGPEAGSAAFFIAIAAAFVIALAARSGGKAWRYMMLISATLCFLMPFSGMLFAGNIIARDGANAGHVVAGALITGALGFGGFFLGIVFLILGLLAGRNRAIVQKSA